MALARRRRAVGFAPAGRGRTRAGEAHHQVPLLLGDDGDCDVGTGIVEYLSPAVATDAVRLVVEEAGPDQAAVRLPPARTLAGRDPVGVTGDSPADPCVHLYTADGSADRGAGHRSAVHLAAPGTVLRGFPHGSACATIGP